MINPADHLGLVHAIARRYAPKGTLREDLVQEGCLGLMLAVSGYDPERGPFAPYAGWWIRDAIQTYARRSMRMVRIGTSAETIRAISMWQAGKIDSADDIATKAEISSEVAEALWPILESRDAGIRGHEPVNDTTPEDICMEAERVAMVRAVVERMTGKMRVVCEMRWMGEATFEECGQAIGASRQRADQIESKARLRVERELRRVA